MATRRLAALTAALRPSVGPSYALEPRATQADAPPRLLTREQLRQFARDGFIALQIDELPASLHQGIYDTARAIKEEAEKATARQVQEAAAAGDAAGSRVWLKTQKKGKVEAPPPPEEDWSGLGPAFQALVDSPTIRGAAASLCGADCAIAPAAAAPQPLSIVDRSQDQQWHKDMTSKGIREHIPMTGGAVRMWYFPCDVTAEMGPTALIPCSHFCGRDRLGCPHSEDRFDQGMGPESPSGAPKTLDEWKSAADNAIYLSGSADERAARLGDGLALLGDKNAIERKMTVPAGSVVIIHDDMVHRRARAGDAAGEVDGVPYRPMFGLTAYTRRSEPTPDNCALAESRAPSAIPATTWSEEESAPGSPKLAVSEALLSWLLGRGCTVPPECDDASVSGAELQARLLRSSSEMERVGAGYIMAARGMLAELAEGLAGSEASRRASCWGFNAAGPAALPVLTPMLGLEQPQVVAHAANALGQAVGNAELGALTADPPSLDKALAAAIDALVAAGARANAAVDRRLQSLSAADLEEMEEHAVLGGRGFDGEVYACVEPMDAEIFEQRAVILGCVTALAAIARRAPSGALSAEICERLRAELEEAAADEDVGGLFPTHVMRGVAPRAAEEALGWLDM